MRDTCKKWSETDIKSQASEYRLPITAEEFTVWAMENSGREGALLGYLQDIHKDKAPHDIDRALCDWVAWVDFYLSGLVTIEEFIGNVYLVAVCDIVCIVGVKYPGDRANNPIGSLLHYLIDKELQKCLDN